MIMRDIAEFTVILREPIVIPGNFKLVTEKFSESWRFALKFNAQQLESRICEQGWGFSRISGGLRASGVGETSQEAIISALKLVVRHTSKQSNVAEVEYIELTHYPWFYLARVRACQYQIKKSMVRTVSDAASPLSGTSRYGIDSVHPDAQNSTFGCNMPRLKRMLVFPDTAGKSEAI
jgi:hypothetical protein